MQNKNLHEDLIYDVGMHRGEDTDYYLKKGFRVVGFEANPDLVAHCRSRFSDSIEAGKLVIVEGAIAENLLEDTKDKTIKFYRNNDTSIWGTVDSDWSQRNEAFGTSHDVIDVPLVDFTGCLKKYGVPHYLKIDIEGMDVVCLRYLEKIEERPNYISIESEKISFEKLIEEINLLRKLGYDKFSAVQQNGISRQKEPNPSREGNYIGYKFSNGSSGLFGADIPYKWANEEQIIKKYRLIFLQYSLFGDYGKLTRFFLGKVLRLMLRKLLRKPIPGWYDTHARHSSLGAD